MSGLAGLKFKDDIISLMKKEWKPKTGGKVPVFTVIWEKKDIGRGNKNYDEVIFTLDGEAVNIFSLRQGAGTYDWLHDLAGNIDIWTSHSEKRSDELADEVIRILKENVVPVINGREYIQLLPTNAEPLHGEMRNIFRWVIDIEAMRKNP